MKPTVIYEEVLAAKKNKNIGFVDVRSPKEYQEATIPGAVNIPVLDNEAREQVGILYVSGEIEAAKKYGVEWTSLHLPAMYQEYQKLCAEHDELVLFCSRGGMRSETIFSLLKALGMPVSRIKGGYKAYRKYVIQHLAQQMAQVEFVTLYGLSGCGKTEILQELKMRGQKILDLEACANHRGSLLGSVGLTEPHSQKMFDSFLFEASLAWKPGEIVYTEGESRRLGKATLPQELFGAMQSGLKILIESPLEKRVGQIFRDYIQPTETEELLQALENMKRVINPDRVAEMQRQIEQGEAKAVIERLLVSYYDPRYSYNRHSYVHSFENKGAGETAKAIIEWQKSEATRSSKI